MKAYVSAKFAGTDNQETVEELCSAVERAGFSVTCTIRDFDDYGQEERDPSELTTFIFDSIEHADVVFLDMTDKGVGLGIEAGYASAFGKPIIALLADDGELSPTLAPLVKQTISYAGFRDLAEQLTNARSQLSQEVDNE